MAIGVVAIAAVIIFAKKPHKQAEKDELDDNEQTKKFKFRGLMATEKLPMKNSSPDQDMHTHASLIVGDQVKEQMMNTHG